MRAYTLTVLQKLSGSSKPIKDQEIVEWANTTLEAGGKSSHISGFKVILSIDQYYNSGRGQLLWTSTCNGREYILLRFAIKF
jgi:hypothetical protein